MIEKCIYCKSENIYFSKKKKKYVCEDCEKEFEKEDVKIKPRKIFLSYGHDENEEIVELIFKKLKERGHNPWIDKQRIKEGDNWRNQIMEGIIESNGFLAFISNHSVRIPGVCLNEISIAVSTHSCRLSSILLEKRIVPPNTISNIQWLDMSDWKEIKKQGDQIWEKWFNNKMQVIYGIVEDEKNNVLSGNIEKLEKKLMPITNSFKLRTLLQNDIVEPKWLMDIIRNQRSKKSIVVIGAPGTGKSVLSAFLCNFVPQCIATFFFEWNNEDTKNTRKIVSSLIFQIACSQEDYQFRLMNILQNRDLIDMTDDEVINDLLINPLNDLIDGGREHCYVVLDAIDEMIIYDNSKINLITQIIDGMPNWITTIITARPEKMIVERLQRYTIINISDHKKEMNNIVRNYISANISNDELTKKIADKCGDSFLNAREMVNLFKENRLDINNFPVEIGGIYYSFFERTFNDYEHYERIIKPIFELVLSAKEQITDKEIENILNLDNVTPYLRKMSSYIVEIPNGNEHVIQVFHKSFLEWLTSDSSGKYRIEIMNGNRRFQDYLINRNPNLGMSLYFAKHGYEHISSKTLEELDEEKLGSILGSLVNAADEYGLLDKEKEYIDYYEEKIGKNKYFYLYALNYYKKVSGVELLKLADETKTFVEKNIKKEQDRFNIICEISFAYFYCGYAEKAYSLITSERKKHNDIFWEANDNDATYWHVVAVSAHNLDSNEEVVVAAKKDKDDYRKNKKFYNQYISMINLFDGYMALGDLNEAKRVAQEVFALSNERYYIHVDDILQICYANLLQTEGKIMESLAYYEKGLDIAKTIQKWDYLYGSIWRELAIAKFGDESCLKALLKYRDISKEEGFYYLVSLADCFYLLALYHLGKNDDDIEESLYNDSCKYGMPGHILQATISRMIRGTMDFDIESIIPLLGRCKGVKGSPTIVYDFLKNFRKDIIDKSQFNILNNWCKKYVQPIVEEMEEVQSNNTQGLPEQPILAKMNCFKCQAMCCYDGVYISDAEENAINEFVSEYPECFADIKKPYIVDGDWPGMRSERKTEKMDYNGYDDSFPEHFTKTRCVFSMSNGECLLQRVATDNQKHPWKIKPRACWSFPIRGIKDDEVIPPVTDKKNDPDRINNKYPGYATFLPCAMTDQESGIKWYEKYKYEIEYYKYLIREDLL